MLDIGSGEFFFLFTDGKLLTTMATVTLITSLVTLLTATALACLVFYLAEFGGASHVAMAATLDPMASLKVLGKPKHQGQSQKVVPALFWFILVAGAISPFAKIGIQQLLLGTLVTEIVTVYPTHGRPTIIRGELFGRPHTLPGIPLLVADKYPQAIANPVRSDLQRENTVLIHPSELIPFPASKNESREWFENDLYKILSPGAFGFDGSLYSPIEYFFMTSEGDQNDFYNATYLTLEIPQGEGTILETSVYKNAFISTDIGVCNFTAFNTITNTQTNQSPPLGLDPGLVYCNRATDPRTNISNTVYGFCISTFILGPSSDTETNANQTFLTMQHFFQPNEGNYNHTDMISSHGFNSIASAATYVRLEHPNSTNFLDFINKYAKNKNLTFVKQVAWKTQFNTTIKLENLTMPDSCSRDKKLARFGDRTIVRWHTPGTSIAMRKDETANAIYDSHLYDISNPKFYGACLGVLVVTVMIAGVLKNPLSLAWSLACSEGFDSSTGQPKEDFTQASWWVVRQNGSDLSIVLVPRPRENEVGYQSYSKAKRAADAMDDGKKENQTRAGYTRLD
ncbi:UNVERIFIED_CONTAM: hypothetical protein HDU68_001169 [Siphonaria sp. JEL0065]|nr:hypothetical protein HDU68_001169 [Siphonaria sp. JEL0065]